MAYLSQQKGVTDMFGKITLPTAKDGFTDDTGKVRIDRTGRNADTEFINKNLTVLNRFTDVKNNSHWAAYDIFEASNDHTGITSGSNEIWSK